MISKSLRRNIKRASKRNCDKPGSTSWKELRAYWLRHKRHSSTVDGRAYAAYIYNLLQ